ncbi:hypothetical protein SAMN04487916_11421 [Arthrobacter sp. ov407]|uniref:hypothetical protein n=1 Tax=Arthrobacter sp. ov407 TaxID=1761748 RepID=UPI00088FB2AA|nr:hypothetical protein [Arthrobacter sp. ov407]SDL76344.1 hypothetical protein SAMN04487916_11421 [Arthrobacter sp. ov407]
MPHLLMSNDEPDTAATPADSSPTVLQFPRLGHTRHRAVRPRQFRGADPGLEPLRRQATSIIDEVLADTNPGDEPVREKLRWHVANNPGQPEKALLEHLRTVADQQESA